MKESFVVALGFALLLAFSTATVAQDIPLVTLDESGVGTLLFPGDTPIPTVGVLAPDPGPGGLAAALTYNLLGPPALVAGDLLLFESPGGALSEIIRFNPAGTGNPAYPASVVFYSDKFDGIDALADVGFPTGLYTNSPSLIEGPIGGGFFGVLYTPSANQPGFVPGFGITYVLRSDADQAVPEPATSTLLGLAIGALAIARRKRHTIENA